MTYRELLQKGEAILKDKEIADYKIDAFLLMEYVFNINRTSYITKGFNDISEEQSYIDRYLECINLRSTHIPLQHITNEQEFMGLGFFVNENVLIPRQDTEVLVEKTMDIVKSYECNSVRVLDMCTGSGCIAISLAKLLNLKDVSAVDLSNKALEVARKNAKFHKVDIEFFESDLFTAITDRKFDIIVSNPPYIRPEVIRTLMEEVRDHEPMMALDGSEDGLKFYREITSNAKTALQDGGYLLYEIGYDQGNEVRAIMENNGFDDIEVIKDLAGLDRVVKGRKKIGGNNNV